jgi:hypothetical protein
MPFLTFVTRCCQRPIQLQKNIESVQSQSSNDWEQLFLVDSENHRDILWANQQLDRYKQYTGGEWVFILDDDCVLIDDEFVATVKEATSDTSFKAELVMVRSVRPQLSPHILPVDSLFGMHWSHWDNIGNRTNCLTYVVKRDLWCATIPEFKGHSGARTFIEAIIRENPHTVWIDRIMSSTQQLGRAKHFEDCQPGWFKNIVDQYGLEKIVQGVWKGKKV